MNRDDEIARLRREPDWQTTLKSVTSAVDRALTVSSALMVASKSLI